MGWLGAVLGLVALGCYDPSYSGGDASGAGDGATATDGAVTGAACGGLRLLADTFDFLGPRWYIYDSDLTTFDGELRIDLPPVLEGSLGVSSTRFYDLRGDEAVVEVVEMFDTATEAWAQLQLRSPGATHLLSITVADGYLHVDIDEVHQMTPWDRSLHQFWRIAETAGQIVLATSPDGASWGTLLSAPTPADLSLVELYLLAGNNGMTEPGVVRFADLNRGVPVGSYCKSSDLVDDFEDGDHGHTWARSFTNAGATIAEVGGALQIALAADTASSYGAVITSTAFDLTGDQVTVHVEEAFKPAANAEIQALLGVIAEDTQAAFVGMSRGSLSCITRDAGGNMLDPCDAQPFLLESHRYWRLREAGGTLYLEVSSTGATFDLVRSVDLPFDPSSVHITLLGYALAASTDPGVARFAGLNTD